MARVLGGGGRWTELRDLSRLELSVGSADVLYLMGVIPSSIVTLCVERVRGMGE